MSGIPYQAYKSKRHSRNLSGASFSLTPSTPPTQNHNVPVSGINGDASSHLPSTSRDVSPSESMKAAVNGLNGYHTSAVSTKAVEAETEDHPIEALSSPDPIQLPLPVEVLQNPSEGKAGPSQLPTTPPVSRPIAKKTSTFKRIPLRPPIGSSPLRNNSRTASIIPATPSEDATTAPPTPPKPKPKPVETLAPTPRIVVSGDELVVPPTRSTSLSPRPPLAQLPVSPSSSSHATASPRSTPLPPTPTTSPPPLRTPVSASRSSTPAHRPTLSAPSAAASASTIQLQQRSSGSAPYRPGFQPKGVYRLHTDDFLTARKASRATGRVEREKLERRLGKLINLHFPDPNAPATPKINESANEKKRPTGSQSSSLFELDIEKLRNIDAGELWKGVLQSQVTPGSKADIRDAEQRITPWQEDASVSKCPICTVSFHPLTNRKHHCRLCGQIICALPPKRPIRLVPCSLLFVVDAQRRIEEVGEGVHYGVSRKTGAAGEDKFLNGVRICKDCRPTLLRQQYYQDIAAVPLFAQIYEALIELEKEIEDDLPQFQELLLSLSQDDAPTKEASSLRKRLLEAFAQYDALAKRIRKIPTPGGKGSSQERVQSAIGSRANLFLQKNMFPLQALPRAKSKPINPDDIASATGSPLIDAPPDLAHALQPLLEQEALLEGFVMEAKAHRKFEDAKTLKENLDEIRAEISRIVAESEGKKRP